MTDPQPPHDTTGAPDGAPARVLVVDATAVARDALSGHLLREGYVVATAERGREAFEMLRAEPFDLVLLGVPMPDMDGPGFLEALRGDAELAHLPVIVVSAPDDLDVVAQCLASGANDYLPAVFRPAMLRTRLSAALDRRRLRDAESLTREMAVARNIQRDFLPESLPAAPGVQLEAALHPARQVSGDFYDAFVLAPSGTIVLVVGDVCDKGVGAALFMALFRSLIRASADPVGGGAIQMIGGRRTIVRQRGRFPDCDLGAMPPFGNLYGLDVYVADSLAEDEEIAFNAGSFTELVRMDYRDFERLVRPKVLRFGTRV